MKNKIAVVTGASSGIGRNIACVLSQMGIQVALVARTKAKLESVQQEIEDMGGTAIIVVKDLYDENAVAEVINEVEARLGEIDIMINNAGFTGMASIHKTRLKNWEKVIRLNLTVPFQFINLLLPKMRKKQQGWIINISSEAGAILCPYSGAYGISKNGLNRLTELVDIENRDYNIHAVSICPGWVDTPLVMDPRLSQLEVEDILSTNEIADTVRWILQQPENLRVGPIISITPIKEQASLLAGTKKFFELHKQLVD